MFKSILKIGIPVMLGIFVLILVGKGLGWFTEAADVAKSEFGVKASLKKYEWFKDASAQLEKKRVDIIIYQGKISDMKSDYEGVSRRNWDRVDKQTLSQWSQELAGIESSYNGLAAQYNSQSSKFNWSSYKITDAPPIEYKELSN